MKLRDKWALVTGGSRGIGRGICIELAKEGCNIVVNYVHDPMKAEATVKELENLKVDAYSIKADVSNRKEVNEMVATIIKRNELDILVSNAGVVKTEPFLEVTKKAWDFQLNVNLLGMFNVAQEVSKYFVERKKGGKIIFVTSFNQDVPNIDHTVYNISKAGVKMLAKTIALELAKYKIYANTIAAGGVITDLNRWELEAYPEFEEKFNKTVPVGRFGTVEEMGKAAVFLASSDSDYTTGSTLYVEGGIMINNAKPLFEKE
jgi:NAD(P)-dependent dehydrogenase (short-subunit alcohol dehydrogenase family)